MNGVRRRVGVSQTMVVALAVLTGAFFGAGTVLTPSVAQAAPPNVEQCNGIGPSAEGATTAMTCTVTVTNTISRGSASSTTTLTRDCKLGPCPPGNGTFTTSSTSLVTSVNQCNDSGNDAAHRIDCDVIIVNNIDADTPQALPLNAATSNQCVGSGQGGGGSTTGCRPTPATTTSATITQCNGSGNGGGGTVACTVDATSRVSRAIPIQVNQCNGSGNPGGSIVECTTRITTNIIAAAAATPSPIPVASAQVAVRPVGGIAAGGGSTSGLRHPALLMLGSGLLLGYALLHLRRTGLSLR